MSTSVMPRFLLIDDDPVFCSLMAASAAKCGVALDAYNSAIEIADVNAIEGYSAAIVDYNLVGMTGLDVAAALAAFLHGLPVVLVSCDPEAIRRQGPLPPGFTYFFPKTIGVEAIIDGVKALSLSVHGVHSEADLLRPKFGPVQNNSIVNSNIDS